jgi:hypothetical protein
MTGIMCASSLLPTGYAWCVASAATVDSKNNGKIASGSIKKFPFRQVARPNPLVTKDRHSSDSNPMPYLKLLYMYKNKTLEDIVYAASLSQKLAMSTSR